MFCALNTKLEATLSENLRPRLENAARFLPRLNCLSHATRKYTDDKGFRKRIQHRQHFGEYRSEISRTWNELLEKSFFCPNMTRMPIIDKNNAAFPDEKLKLHI